MRSLRAAEKSRIGIEIKPKVRYPFQTEVAIECSFAGIPAGVAEFQD
jgi:hypothetical protein